jgi:hypothetical protein
MADPKDLESVRTLFAAHKDEILRRYGAVGGGIGRNENEYVITVYLRSKNDSPAEPVSIEGVRVRFEVTGEFHLHAG